MGVDITPNGKSGIISLAMKSSCGILHKHINDPLSVFKHDETGWFLLSKSNDRIEIIYCLLCGGELKGSSPKARGGHSPENNLPIAPCSCILEQVEDPDSPVATDLRLQEFYIHKESEGRKLRFSLSACPWCGKALPKSRRDDLFTTPTPEDQTRIDELVRGAKTLDDVINRLGENRSAIGPPAR